MKLPQEGNEAGEGHLSLLQLRARAAPRLKGCALPCCVQTRAPASPVAAPDCCCAAVPRPLRLQVHAASPQNARAKRDALRSDIPLRQPRRRVCVLLGLAADRSCSHSDPHTRRGSTYCAQERIVHADRKFALARWAGARLWRHSYQGLLRGPHSRPGRRLPRHRWHPPAHPRPRCCPSAFARPAHSHDRLSFIGSLGDLRCAGRCHGAIHFIPVLAATARLVRVLRTFQDALSTTGSSQEFNSSASLRPFAHSGVQRGDTTAPGYASLLSRNMLHKELQLLMGSRASANWHQGCHKGDGEASISKRKLCESERLTGLLWERAALSESLLSGIASTRL